MTYTGFDDFVDLTDRGRGFGPISLPSGFPAGESGELLAQIESKFCPPNPRRDNSYAAAVRRLARYAAGRESLTADSYRLLRETADEYEGIMRAPVHGHESNRAMTAFVLKHAGERAAAEGLVS